MRMRMRCSWPTVATVVWGGLVLGFAIHAFRFPWAHTVYDIYALAARKWWAGLDLYVGGREHYRYSPLFAIGITPFAFLPDCLGTPLWKAFNIAFYAWGLWTWVRQVLPADLGSTRTAALFLLVLPTSLHSMYNGQANLIVLGACLLGLAAIAGGRYNQAAIWLALATLTKGYPLALGLLLAALYPRRFAARFAVALGAGLLLPFATHRPGVVLEQNLSWLHHLRDSAVIMRERLRSIDYLFQAYHHPLSPSTFAVCGLLAGLVILALCLLEARQISQNDQRVLRAFLLFAAWVVLFGPATESCTYAVIAPAIAWRLIDAFRRPADRETRLLLIVSFLMMGPLVTDMVGSTVRNFANEHGSQPIGALLFLIHLLAQTGRTAQPAALIGVTPQTAPLDAAA